MHIEPIASLRIASHSIREVIYGANDSMVTVLRRCSWLSAAAVVRVVLVIGVANLFADRLLSSNAVTLLAIFAPSVLRALGSPGASANACTTPLHMLRKAAVGASLR